MSGIMAILLLLQHGAWASIPPMPDARQEVGAIAVEGRVYVIGGLDSNGAASTRVDIFDTHTGTWQPAPAFPIPVHHSMVAAAGHKIYVAGGYTDPGFLPHARTYEFDPDLSIWTRKADMPTVRGAGAAASYGGKVYVFGGERTGESVNEVAAYDPIANSWTTVAPMPTPRNHLGAALAHGKIYVVGGRPGNLSVNEAFDVAAGSWTTQSPLPTGRSGIAAAAIGKYVYVFGGEGNAGSPSGTFSENEAYDADADIWTAVEAMPMPRHGIGAGVAGNRIYIPAGGPVAGFGTTAQSDFFEAAQDIVLPQFVVGGGYRTEIFLSNPASRSADINMSITDMNGSPLATTIDGVQRSAVSVTVAPLGSRTFSAPDTSGTLRAGTVRIRSNVRVNVFAVVRLTGSPAVTVYPASPARSAMVQVRLNRNSQTNTGLAVANTGPASASVVLTLLNDSGNEVARIDRSLAPGGQLSRFVDELFANLQQSDFQGTITVRSSQAVSVVALAFDRDGILTIPVVPIE
ncbi:MAG TPA: kelch repeat-containing protein [Terriglobia bacterium]|nr:kelch repeat-containing protein [Terriglobia bacterium]